MVKDCPYWTCSTIIPHWFDKYKGKQSLAALKFDVTSNKFKLLPEFTSDYMYVRIFTVVNSRDLLTLMAYDPCPSGMLDIYSLQEEKGCGGVWSKMCCFGPFEKCGRFENLQQGFKYGDEIVLHQNREICRYDHKTDTFECILGTKPDAFNCCFTYTPNLVFLHGMTSIYSENQSPPLGRQSSTPLCSKGLEIMNLGGPQAANGVASVLQNDDDVDPHLERIKNETGGEESDEEDEDFFVEKDDFCSPTRYSADSFWSRRF